MQLPYETSLARVTGNRRLLALTSPYLLREAFPPPRVPGLQSPGWLMRLHQQLSLPQQAPGRGRKYRPPTGHSALPAAHWLQGPSVLRGGGASRPLERNLRVPGPSPTRLHGRGSFAPLFRRPFSHSPRTVAVPMTSPRDKVFKLHLFCPTQDQAEDAVVSGVMPHAD